MMMRSIGLLLLFGVIINVAHSQGVSKKIKNSGDTTTPVRDSMNLQNEIKTNLLDNIPVIAIDDNEVGGVGDQSVSSVLSASRDPFLDASTFNFFIARFRPRGYDFNNSSLFMNGAPIENLENGSGSFSAFGGMSSIMRNRENSLGIKPNSFGFGGVGTNTNLELQPSTQRKRTEIGYSFSDRAYTHRWSFTHSTGLNKNGWAFTVSANRRWSDEGYVEGTYTNSWSYFIGIDKKISKNRTISLSVFGSPSESGGQKNVVTEADTLLKTHYYNPAWGFQNGKKRNSSVIKTNQPYIILSDEIKLNNNSTLVNAASFSFGDRGSTGLDYFNYAPSPNPDYYKNLPSYQTNPITAKYVAQRFKSDVNVRQINWQHLYDANRSNLETINNASVDGLTGQTYTGYKSSYILGERVTNSQKANFSSTYNTRIGKNANLTAGVVLLSQNDHNYKKADDLLGGQYFVDVNQYAIGSFPSNPSVQYPNLPTPNNIVKTDGIYGYNYNTHINKEEVWLQGAFKYNKFDFFAAGQFSNTQFWRYGNWQTGLYPNNSLGKSAVYNFNNGSIKGGLTYKIDGKNYLYANAAYLTRAPEFRNVFLSPDTRDQVQDNITSEKITSVEGGYIVNAPFVRAKLSGYYTKFANQMSVLSFFNEDYYTFTNYALSNISKVHYGSELGIEAKITPEVQLTGAASVGRYYYDSRMNATTVNDNTTGILSKDIVYAKDYRVANTPQEAYSFGIHYRSKKYWYVGLSGNYFNQMWSNFNPVRRTVSGVSNATYGSQTWNDILKQEQLPGQFILDLNAGYSWKLPSNWLNRFTLLLVNMNISNLTNNKNLVTYAGEQLRFDNGAPTEFPPKYSYAYGLTYALNVTLRF